jgi:PST family polysaccharide transporter
MTDGAAARPRFTRSLALSGISSASAALLLVLYARASDYLSQPEFGLFQYALVLASLAETLIDLGMHQITIRAVARDRASAPKLLHNTLTFKGLPAVVVVAATAVYLWSTDLTSTERVFCLLMVASAVPRSYFMTVRGVLLGLERFGRDTALVVIDRAALLAAGLLALSAHAGLMGIALVFLLTRTATLAAALLVARGLVGALAINLDTRLWRSLQQTALPVGVFMIVLSFYTYIDTVMLTHMTTTTETALYGAAYRLYEGLCYAPSILAAALSPRLAALWKTDRARHRRLAYLGLLGAVGLAIALALPVIALAEPLVTALFGKAGGPDYAAAAPTLRILAAGLVFIFPIWILHSIAISTFREHLLLRTTIVGAIVNVVLNFWLIPLRGPDGAAMATVIGEGLCTALLVAGLWSALRRQPGDATA